MHLPFLLPLLVLMSMLLSGCETLRQSPQVDLVEPGNYPTRLASAQEAPVLRTTGGLFKASTYRPSFEDRRARIPGDMVTVQISENISALVAYSRARAWSPAPTFLATSAAAAMPQPIDTERLENTMVPA